MFTKNTSDTINLTIVEQQIINKYLQLRNNNYFQERKNAIEQDLINLNRKYNFDFREKYSIKTLANIYGKDLLMYFFAPKEDEQIGLSRILEYETQSWGMFTGFDCNKTPVAYCSYKNMQKAWRTKNGDEISETEAIKIAEDVKDKILELNHYLTSKDYQKFIDVFPDNQYYRFYHKFFYMLYPEYLTSYHSRDFAPNIKSKLNIDLSKKLELEKYFINLINKTTYTDIKVDDLRLTVEKLWGYGVSVKNHKNGENEIMQQLEIPLNQILYGPPGTGKTYNTIIKAMEILTFKSLFEKWYKDVYCSNKNVKEIEKTLKDYVIHIEKINNEYLLNSNIFSYFNKEDFNKLKEQILNSDYIKYNTTRNNPNSYYQHGLKRYEEFLNWIDYDKIKNEFNDYRKQHQIEFVTFHQSYSYEEFVEGIKPDIDNWNDSTDKLTYKGTNGVFKKICRTASEITSDNFDEIYTKFIDDLLEYDEENLFKLKTSKGKTFGILVNSNKNLSLYMGKNLTKWGTLTKNNLKNISDWKYYAIPIYEYLKTHYGLLTHNIKNSSKSYVLIIDEINRGNISKIFGELITLIEDDKRETLSLTLPYSHEPFTVPKNLYIIGTMNTSDRSIATIDIALRRRFKFIEMMPRPELLKDKNVGDVNLEKLLKTLNERISYLLDRDHQIGHSYFMNWEKYDVETLKNVWFDSIMPLLNEYFYSDWDKLQNVLGEAKGENSFIIKIEKPKLPNADKCYGENYYYNFAKKEDVNDVKFAEMLKNAGL